MTASITTNPPGAGGALDRFRRFIVSQQGLLIVVLAVLVGFFTLISKDHNFWSKDVLTNVLNDFCPIALLAIGATFVIISGGIDLSVGSNAAMSGVVAALTMRNLTSHDVSPYLTMVIGVLAALVCGGAVGVVNAALINLAKLVPFVATLATLGICAGLAVVFTRGGPVGDGPRSQVFAFSIADMWAFSKPMIIVGAIVLTAGAFLHRSRFGRYTFAIGSNSFAARAAGISVTRHIVKVYVLSGALAGAAGVFYYLRLGSGSPSSGLGRELDAIAAVVVGGVALTGGVGTMSGVVLGALVLATVPSGLSFTDLDPNYRQVFVGILIALAAAVQALLKPKGRPS